MGGAQRSAASRAVNPRNSQEHQLSPGPNGFPRYSKPQSVEQQSSHQEKGNPNLSIGDSEPTTSKKLDVKGSDVSQRHKVSHTSAARSQQVSRGGAPPATTDTSNRSRIEQPAGQRSTASDAGRLRQEKEPSQSVVGEKRKQRNAVDAESVAAEAKANLLLGMQVQFLNPFIFKFRVGNTVYPVDSFAANMAAIYNRRHTPSLPRMEYSGHLANGPGSMRQSNTWQLSPDQDQPNPPDYIEIISPVLPFAGQILQRAMATASAEIEKYFCLDHSAGNTAIAVYHVDLSLATLQRLAQICVYFEGAFESVMRDSCPDDIIPENNPGFDFPQQNWSQNGAIRCFSLHQVFRAIQETTTMDALVNLICPTNGSWYFRTAQAPDPSRWAGLVEFRFWRPFDNFDEAGQRISWTVDFVLRCMQIPHINNVFRFSRDKEGLQKFVGSKITLLPPTRANVLGHQPG